MTKEAVLEALLGAGACSDGRQRVYDLECEDGACLWDRFTDLDDISWLMEAIGTPENGIETRFCLAIVRGCQGQAPEGVKDLLSEAITLAEAHLKGATPDVPTLDDFRERCNQYYMGHGVIQGDRLALAARNCADSTRCRWKAEGAFSGARRYLQYASHMTKDAISALLLPGVKAAISHEEIEKELADHL